MPPKHTPLKYGCPIKMCNQISPRILCTRSDEFGILQLHLSGMCVRQTWLLRLESIPWSSCMSCKYLSFKSCNWNLGTINKSVILLYEHGQLVNHLLHIAQRGMKKLKTTWFISYNPHQFQGSIFWPVTYKTFVSTMLNVQKLKIVHILKSIGKIKIIVICPVAPPWSFVCSTSCQLSYRHLH